MKKLLAVLLAAVTCLCLLAACDKGADVPTANAGCKRAVERAIEYRLGVITKEEFRLMHVDPYWQDVSLDTAWEDYQAMKEEYILEAAEYYGEDITYTVTVSNERKATKDELKQMKTRLEEGSDPDLLHDAYVVDFTITIAGSTFSESSSGKDATFIYYNETWFPFSGK